MAWISRIIQRAVQLAGHGDLIPGRPFGSVPSSFVAMASAKVISSMVRSFLAASSRLLQFGHSVLSSSMFICLSLQAKKDAESLDQKPPEGRIPRLLFGVPNDSAPSSS